MDNDTLLAVALTTAEPFNLIEEFLVEDKNFRLRVVSGELNSNPTLVFIDENTSNEYVIPFNIWGIDSLRGKVKEKLNNAQDSYKIEYGKIGETFNLHPLLSYTSRLNAKGEEVVSKYSLDNQPDVRDGDPRKPRLIFDRHYCSSPVSKHWDSLTDEEKSRYGGWLLRYAGQTLSSASWYDRESIAALVELMRDADAMATMFVLTSPKEAKKLGDEEAEEEKRFTVLATLVSGQRNGFLTDKTGNKLAMPIVSNAEVVNKLRVGQVSKMLWEYVRRKNTCSPVSIRFDDELVEIGIQLRLKEHFDADWKNPSKDKETFILAVAQATGYKVFGFDETETILSGKKELNSFAQRLFLVPTEIHQVLQSDITALRQDVILNDKKGRSWF